MQFARQPVVVTDPSGASTSYLNGVDEDTESVIVAAPTAYGAVAESTPQERALLFLDVPGEPTEVLANTQTRLGPFPAAYFISRVILDDGRPAVIYGTTVVRPADVHYVFFTDVGGDDGDRGRAFVESYVVPIDLPQAWSGEHHNDHGGAGTVHSSAPPAAATSTSTATTTTSIAPPGATLSFDGRWWVRFPDGADITLRASSQDGFAFAEYVATVGEDALSVRVTELPAAARWVPTDAAATDAADAGSTVDESAIITLDGAPAARFTLADAEGLNTEVLLVRSGGQLYRVAYVDGGDPSSDDADNFVDSFHLR